MRDLLRFTILPAFGAALLAGCGGTSTSSGPQSLPDGGSSPEVTSRECADPSATVLAERGYVVDYNNRHDDDMSDLALHVSGDFVYARTISGLYKIPRAGGDATKISPREFVWSAIRDQKFYGYSHPSFWELDLATGQERALATAEDAWTTAGTGSLIGGEASVAFDGQAFFYASSDTPSADYPNRVVRLPTEGGQATEIAREETAYSWSSSIYVAVDGEFVYWQLESPALADGHVVKRASKTGGTAETIVLGGDTGKPITVASNSVFYQIKESTGQSYTLERLDLQTRTHAPVLQATVGSLWFRRGFESSGHVFGAVDAITDISGLAGPLAGSVTIWEASTSAATGSWFGCRSSYLIEDFSSVTADDKSVFTAITRPGPGDETLIKIIRWDR